MSRGLRSAVVVGIAALAAAACAPRAAVRADGGASAASDADVATYARLLASADARRPDTALLDSAIGSRWPALRAAGTLAVGQLHVTGRAARLRALLGDPDTSVAANAAFALGLLRDSASVPALAAAVHAGAPAVSREAAWSLGEIGALARAAIVDALGGSTSDGTLPALLIAAGRLRPLPADAIRPFADGPRSVSVTRAAAYALARTRAPVGVRTLLSLASHSDGEVREQAARGLARTAAGDSLGDSARAVLARLASDTSAHVRINAVRSLGTYGAGARAVLVAALHDADPNVRVAAAQSIAGVLGTTRRDWREAWNADTGFMYRRSLIASAVASGVILDAIDEDNADNWQRMPDWRYRAAVAEATAGAGQLERIVDVALPLTRDHDGRVRAAAYGVFAPYVDSAGFDSHPWRRDFLLPALRDEDVQVRASVLTALASRARASEIPAVLASYRTAAADSVSDARVAAVHYLASAWRLDSAAFTDSVRAAIRALPVPSDPLERAEGKNASPLAHWNGDPAGPAHPLAWYERVVREIVMPSLAGRPRRAEIVTERGTITVELLGADAPLTTLNFLRLAGSGYMNGTRFHRVVPNFVAQGGDPRGDGNGGPGYAIRDELNRHGYERGALGMALSGPDTGGSQFFLTLSPQPHLDGHYTVFGRVVAGADAMDRLVQGDRVLTVRVP